MPDNFCNQNYFDLLTEMIIMVAPIIPHFASECWNILGNKINSKKYKIVSLSILPKRILNINKF